LLPFGNDKNLQLRAGQLISYSFDATTSELVTGSSTTVDILRGDEFTSQIKGVLASSSDNLAKLRMIGTHDDVFDDGFAVGPNKIEFIINDNKPLQRNKTMNASSLESLFNDPRVGNISNFQYLPPITKLDNTSIDKRDYRNLSSYMIGKYPPWGRTHLTKINGSIIKSELAVFEKMGYQKTVNFEPTSKQNNVICQFFEIQYDVANKLDIIDFGVVIDDTGAQQHVFFVGKLITTQTNTQTFIHLFTLGFE
jgi:hypothetical protein